MRIFISHKNTHLEEKKKKKEVESLFQPVKYKEPHILRRWNNDNWRGKSVKGWYNANPMMKAYKRRTAPATQNVVSLMAHANAEHCVSQDIKKPRRYHYDTAKTTLNTTVNQ